jgi:hypothetical protein
MLFPDTSPIKWARLYDLRIETHECLKCGTPLTANIPFACKDWRGFVSAPHGCGREFDLQVLAPAGKTERAELAAMHTQLSAALMVD